jgi:N-acetyl-gamma-glutamyl-phosphate reductase
MSIRKINIAVIGATGFTGLDLIYLLCKHPKIHINYLCATKNLGEQISFFDKRIKKKLPKITSTDSVNWDKVDLVFLSLPNNEAQKLIKKLYKKYEHIKFIDLSADFRITDLKKYKQNYKKQHYAPELVKNSIYALSEFISDKINKYRIIANPGCYPTSIQIPLVPLLKKKLIHNFFTIDSKSGFSGAGKNLEKKFTHKNLHHSTFAYGINHHRHICEIDQELLKLTNKKIKFTFNPYLLPTFRGILSSIYVHTKSGVSPKQLRNTLIKFYKNDKFIRILKLNTPLGSGNVLNSNYCEISICKTRIKNKYIIFSAIDNLVKGASGQAIQNMNLLYNYPELLGLK